MEINGPYSVHGAHAIKPAAKANFSQPAQLDSVFEPRDEFEISPEGNWLSKVDSLPEIRTDRVAQIKAEIATGAYDSDHKLDAALDRLLDEIG
jgi:negative regulator of flagellin synthesis FlgM